MLIGIDYKLLKVEYKYTKQMAPVARSGDYFLNSILSKLSDFLARKLELHVNAEYIYDNRFIYQPALDFDANGNIASLISDVQRAIDKFFKYSIEPIIEFSGNGFHVISPIAFNIGIQKLLKLNIKPKYQTIDRPTVLRTLPILSRVGTYNKTTGATIFIIEDYDSITVKNYEVFKEMSKLEPIEIADEATWQRWFSTCILPLELETNNIERCIEIVEG